MRLSGAWLREWKGSTVCIKHTSGHLMSQRGPKVKLKNPIKLHMSPIPMLFEAKNTLSFMVSYAFMAKVEGVPKASGSKRTAVHRSKVSKPTKLSLREAINRLERGTLEHQTGKPNGVLFQLMMNPSTKTNSGRQPLTRNQCHDELRNKS